MSSKLPIRRALLSVSDKSGLVELATELHQTFGIELIATGGTKKSLCEAGLPVKDVSELTGYPEILDGRVKTLHPAIYAGLLAKRSKSEHMSTLAEHKLPEIDLVVCNLYPFEKTIAKPDATEAEAIENIDIGGPCMVRAAAKNFESVVVLPDPGLYADLLTELNENNKTTTRSFRKEMASVAFQLIRQYDEAIEEFFLNECEVAAETELLEPGEVSEWDEEFDPPFNLVQPLRYGENPHQKAAFYAEVGLNPEYACVATAEQLHGKELSYNNILDLDAALSMVRELSEPSAIIVKHNNPCGAASAPQLADAFLMAWDGDPISAFGGIIAFNRPVDLATATALKDPKAKRFVECVIAPGFEPDALDALKKWKENVRLLKTADLSNNWKADEDADDSGFQPLDSDVEVPLDYRRVDGGLLVQTRDTGADDHTKWVVKTQRAPTPQELDALKFAWHICKYVKSNAIVLGSPATSGSGSSIVGVGAGQMSRVMSVEIAVRKAGERSKGSVLASDAFFPFPDNVELATAAGVTAIVQPGGSVKDEDSIAACNKYGIAMVFTGVRHFRH